MKDSALVDLLQEEFDSYCQRIEKRERPYRFPTQRQDTGAEHLEIVDDDYHLVCTERGLELSRRSTHSKDELMYWLVSSFSWARAVDYEVRNRIEGRDFRRMLFAKWTSYVGIVNESWAQRVKNEIDQILAKHPFDDNEENIPSRKD